MLHPSASAIGLRRAAAVAVAIGLLAPLGGCAIAEMQKTNRDIDERNRAGEAVLADEQRRHEVLAAQTAEWQANLRRSELSAAQLKTQLEQMGRANEAAPARTPEQRQSRQRRSEQLADASRQAQALDRDATLSRQEKARQLEALKEKTRKMLELLLAG